MKKSPASPLNEATWVRMRDEFVRGDIVEGRRRYPTMIELSGRYGVRVGSIEKKSHGDPDGSWMVQRRKLEQVVRRRGDEAYIEQLADSRRTFDDHSLLAAHGVLKKVVAVVQRVRLFDPDGQPVRGVHAKLRTLSAALVNAQRVGRLALGCRTESSEPAFAEAADLTDDEAINEWRRLARASPAGPLN